MYYPYVRGKQNELLAIRQTANLLAKHDFRPIIEPVKMSTAGLERALETLCEANGSTILIANPEHGELKYNHSRIKEFINENYKNTSNICIGILLSEHLSIDDTVHEIKAFSSKKIYLIHKGFLNPQLLAERLKQKGVPPVAGHIFVASKCNDIYKNSFTDWPIKILLKDGFVKAPTNKDYIGTEAFSKLHLTFAKMGMTGFGDYLTVGDNYSDGGGPARAVAIHLTLIDKLKNDEMFIKHYISNSNDDANDPAGKFLEALNKLIKDLNAGSLPRTSATREYENFHKKQHFPGLGYLKKLSLVHHVEIISDFFTNQLVDI